MTWDSAKQFIANMNAYSGIGYLSQTNWELPPLDPTCPGYRCDGARNPMGNLFYGQLEFDPGMPVVAVPDLAVGPFHDFQPYLYWSCEASRVQDPCQIAGPVENFEWSFSMGSGFQGTDVLANDLNVTAYFPGPPTTVVPAPFAPLSAAQAPSE